MARDVHRLVHGQAVIPSPGDSCRFGARQTRQRVAGARANRKHSTGLDISERRAVGDRRTAAAAHPPAGAPRAPAGAQPRGADGIIFVQQTGIPWEHFPQELGCCGMTLWNRLRDWQRVGGPPSCTRTWATVLAATAPRPAAAV
jgi:hypothetical protein